MPIQTQIIVSRLATVPMDTAEGCGIRGAGVGLGSGLCALPFKKNYLPAVRLKAGPGQRCTLGPRRMMRKKAEPSCGNNGESRKYTGAALKGDKTGTV